MPSAVRTDASWHRLKLGDALVDSPLRSVQERGQSRSDEIVVDNTAVHLMTAGIAIRVPRSRERSALAAIDDDVPATLLQGPSERPR